MTGSAGVNPCGCGTQPGRGTQDDFDTMLQTAQSNMARSMSMSGMDAGAAPSGFQPSGGPMSRMGGMGQGGFRPTGFGPPPGMGACARGGAGGCGCNGNVSSSMSTTSGGAPLSTFDFMSGGANGTGGMTMPGMGGGYGGVPDFTGIAAQARAMAPTFGSGGMYGSGGMSGGGMGGMHSGGGMYGSGGGMGGMSSGGMGMSSGGMGMGGMHGGGMGAMHDGHGYYSLDGIGMVHAKDQLRAGQHLTDNAFFERVANGQFGAPSGVSLNMGADGNLDGQVHISGHPAAFHQLYDEGRAQGLTGEDLNQYIAEELTNVNDIDDIDERYYRTWEARGYARPTRDHDLHNTGSVAVTLAPGQTLNLNGAHQYDTIDDPAYNFTDVQTDGRGTYIELYRLSNNNDNGNGHHEDLVLAARIYLDQNEIERLADGVDPLTIANERITVVDDTDQYRITTGAINLMARWGMPIY